MHELATDEEILARVRECVENGNTLGGGGVTAEQAADDLPIKARTVERRFYRLAKQGRLERDLGFDADMKQRTGYRPTDDPRVMADGSGQCANPDCETSIDPGAASRYCSMACELADRHGLEGREIRADGGTQQTLGGDTLEDPETSEDYKFSRPQCKALTDDGDRCTNPVRRTTDEADLCPAHYETDCETIDDQLETDGGTDTLPTPCPQCGTTLETREDAMVHMFKHWGDGEIEPLGGDSTTPENSQ